MRSRAAATRLASEVVFSGAEASHEDDDVGARDGEFRGLLQVIEIVAHDGFEADIDAELVETLGEEKRIGVLAERGEQFRTDGDDLGVHDKSLNDGVAGGGPSGLRSGQAPALL